MLPKLKYLKKKLFLQEVINVDRRIASQDKMSSRPEAEGAIDVRHRLLAGELFTGAQPAIPDNLQIIDNSRPHSFASGPFAGANNFTITNLTMNDYFVTGQPVLYLLRAAGAPDAGLDAGARYPLPRCHPGSRRTINKKLGDWFSGLHRQWKMVWLHGPAGVGKSAVAQTFAEVANKEKHLGAAFFFSSLDDKRSNPLRIIPSLAYQIAIHNESYKRILTHQLATDPSVLDAVLNVQFQKLIVEPFSFLASSGSQRQTEHPYVIVLDGLDECSDEQAQCELVELINNAAQRDDLPFLWLVCSRPEPHIEYTFSRPDYSIHCTREELPIDDEAREDVERYLRDTFKEIHASHQHVIAVPQGEPWPPEEIFDIISKAASGLFVLASAITRVVGDRSVGDPEGQLKSVLNMLKGLDDIGVNSPLEALDIFYSRILAQVPSHILPTATQILGLCTHTDWFNNPLEVKFTAKRVWLFLRIEPRAFYSALQKLHSVVKVPPPENAQHEGPSFYHKSFPDYLGSQHRSRQFCITKTFLATFATGVIHLYNHILIYAHPLYAEPEEHSHSQSTMKEWYSENDGDIGDLSEKASHLGVASAVLLQGTQEGTIDLFDAIPSLHFGLVGSNYHLKEFLRIAIHQNWNQKISPHFIRTEVVDVAVDSKLLHHLSTLTSGKSINPIDITCAKPLGGLGLHTMGFVILGHGSRSCLMCIFREAVYFRVIGLNSRLPPTAGQITEYRFWEMKLNDKDKELQENSSESEYETCSEGSE